MNTIWDPLRKKEVPLTPEEEVRQWFIRVMKEHLGVPVVMMCSEVGLKYGEGPIKKDYRADIVVYGHGMKPVMVVECKKPQVALDAKVIEQALRYAAVLGVEVMALTNGASTRAFMRDGENFREVVSFPKWNEIKEGL